MTPIETPNTIHIKIVEPPIAGMFYIRDKWLKKAKETKKKIVLEYNGEKYVATYKEWMKGAKKMEKVFLIKEQPMVLFGNYIRRFLKQNLQPISWTEEGALKVATAWRKIEKSI